MILSYILLVGSTSAKDIFNQCMGAYMKKYEDPSRNPLDVRASITKLITAELNGLVSSGKIVKIVNHLGQVFYKAAE